MKIRRTRTPVRTLTLIFLLSVLPSAVPLQAQNPFKKNPAMEPWDRLVCPLSDAQQQKAIDAFAKMAPTFHHDRCSNCHGGIDPFANPTDHVGGTRDRGEMDQGGCNQCHDNLLKTQSGKGPKWELPVLPDHSFVGKDAKTLCEMQHKFFHRGADFEFHILNDNGKTDFQMIAFLGTRGLHDVMPKPIQGLTLGQFFDQAVAWVEAMGGDFQGDERCGCEPVHFAVRVTYLASFNVLGVVQGQTLMGPVDIPITFHDDKTYEGTGTLQLKGGDVAGGVCVGQSQGTITIKVSGRANEEWEDNSMQINLTNTSPVSGSTAVQCPYFSRVFGLKGGDKAAFGFNVSGKAGDFGIVPVPLPAPGMNANLRVDVKDLSPVQPQ